MFFLNKKKIGLWFIQVLPSSYTGERHVEYNSVHSFDLHSVLYQL